MAKENELDKLSLDMIECEKAGFGCSYGKWKASLANTEDRSKNLPEGWKICEWCGKWYKPKQQKSNQRYCESVCQQQAKLARRQKSKECDKK